MKAEASTPYMSGTTAAKSVYGSLDAVEPGAALRISQILGVAQYRLLVV